ncbi:hypothetical protein LIER_41760 [Lithospermum erythrorhizon]|uniref:Uncharacterized protein n=1 Tax=Lithospermum erythrorhizon TaxID=34254 RepID=A0AAV3RF51_LITER
MVGTHTCGTSMKIPTITVKWLAKKYVNKVRRQPKISLKAFIGDIYDDLKVEIDIVPGSTAIIKQEEQKFQRIYVCPAPLKRAFLDGCRLFLCLDGCFLKGVFKGQILAIVGLDADNRIYPIAWVVIEVENTDS